MEVIDVDASLMAGASGGGKPPGRPGPPMPEKGGLFCGDDGEEDEEEEDGEIGVDYDLRPCRKEFGGCGQRTYLRKEMCINRFCVGFLIVLIFKLVLEGFAKFAYAAKYL